MSSIFREWLRETARPQAGGWGSTFESQPEAAPLRSEGLVQFHGGSLHGKQRHVTLKEYLTIDGERYQRRHSGKDGLWYYWCVE